MAHINTLQRFDELVAAGVPEHQARAHVDILNSSFDSMATKDDLHREIKQLETRIDMRFSMIEKVGGSFLIAIFVLLLKVAIWG